MSQGEQSPAGKMNTMIYGIINELDLNTNLNPDNCVKFWNMFNNNVNPWSFPTRALIEQLPYDFFECCDDVINTMFFNIFNDILKITITTQDNKNIPFIYNCSYNDLFRKIADLISIDIKPAHALSIMALFWTKLRLGIRPPENISSDVLNAIIQFVPPLFMDLILNVLLYDYGKAFGMFEMLNSNNRLNDYIGFIITKYNEKQEPRDKSSFINEHLESLIKVFTTVVARNNEQNYINIMSIFEPVKNNCIYEPSVISGAINIFESIPNIKYSNSESDKFFSSLLSSKQQLQQQIQDSPQFQALQELKQQIQDSQQHIQQIQELQQQIQDSPQFQALQTLNGAVDDVLRFIKSISRYDIFIKLYLDQPYALLQLLEESPTLDQDLLKVIATSSLQNMASELVYCFPIFKFLITEYGFPFGDVIKIDPNDNSPPSCALNYLKGFAECNNDNDGYKFQLLMNFMTCLTQPPNDELFEIFKYELPKLARSINNIPISNVMDLCKNIMSTLGECLSNGKTQTAAVLSEIQAIVLERAVSN